MPTVSGAPTLAGPARAIHGPARRINAIVLGKRTVTAATDLRLARCFRVSEGFFPGRQAGYELKTITPRTA